MRLLRFPLFSDITAERSSLCVKVFLVQPSTTRYNSIKSKIVFDRDIIKGKFFCCWSAIIWTLLLLHTYYNTWPVHSASTKNKSILIELPPSHFFVLTTPTNQRRYLICLKHQNNNLPAVKISVPILFKGLSAEINREPLK